MDNIISWRIFIQQVWEKALALIETETDTKDPKKYASLWKVK